MRDSVYDRAWPGLWHRSHFCAGDQGGSVEKVAFELGLGQWAEIEQRC